MSLYQVNLGGTRLQHLHNCSINQLCREINLGNKNIERKRLHFH